MDSSTSNGLDENNDESLTPLWQSLVSPVSFSNLCHCYDRIMQMMSVEQRNDRELSRNDDFIMNEASRLCALQLTCQLLLGIMDEKTISDKKNELLFKKRVLEQTIRRSQLLLCIMQEKYGLDLPQVAICQAHLLQYLGQAIDVVPHPKIKGLYCYGEDNSNDEDDSVDSAGADGGNDNILTFERQILEEEEAELMQMANTPIPSENESAELRSNKMKLSWKSELQAEWSQEEYIHVVERARKRQKNWSC